jgi:hypothetical protein
MSRTALSRLGGVGQPSSAGPAAKCRIVALFLVAAVLIADRSARADAGLDTHISKDGDHGSMSAGDFFKLLDRSLGDKFQDLVLVFGGCFTKEFTDKGKTSVAGKSKKNFGVLSATSDKAKCEGEFSLGTQQGGAFAQGVANGFDPTYADPNGKEPGTVDDAFTTGKNRVRRERGDDANAQTPTLWPANNRSKKIRLGRAAESYHAILFSGYPKDCADWWDIVRTREVLLKSGYKAADIKILFGNGKRGDDGTPILADGRTVQEHKDNKDGKNAKNEGGCPYQGLESERDESGKPAKIDYSAGTYDGLKDALENLKKLAEKDEKEQYFIWTGSHNTTDAKDYISMGDTKPTKYVGRFEFPGFEAPGDYVTFSGDSTKQCTFADGTRVSMPVTFADDNGNPIADDRIPVAGGAPVTQPPRERTDIDQGPPAPTPWVTSPPSTDRTELAPPPTTEPRQSVPPEQPKTATSQTPPREPETPPKTSTAEPPPTTDTTPPTQTTDAPPTTPRSEDVPSTVFFKGNEEVARGGPTGQPLGGTTLKLLAERPALPGRGASKQDTGFDKPPVQCTTGADGECKARVLADERPVYGLPTVDTGVGRPNYRIEFNALQSSGAVAEVTGRKPFPARAPTDGNVASDTFKIGNRIFQRFGFNLPHGSKEDVQASYRATFGDKLQVDTCETKKPGPPLGMEPISLEQSSHELSQATIKLDRAMRSARNGR